MIPAAARGEWMMVRAALRPFVARRVRPSDVDDVLQEIFLRMHRALPRLRDDERFGPWVYRIARSAVVDHLRAARRQPLAEEENERAEPAPVGSEVEGAAAEELAAYVGAFVAMLDSPYREALTLTELQGMSQKDAAAMLGLSTSGMKSRVQRGRRQLRSALEACCEIALDGRGRVLSCEPCPDGKLPGACCR